MNSNARTERAPCSTGGALRTAAGGGGASGGGGSTLPITRRHEQLAAIFFCAGVGNEYIRSTRREKTKMVVQHLMGRRNLLYSKTKMRWVLCRRPLHIVEVTAAVVGDLVRLSIQLRCAAPAPHKVQLQRVFSTRLRSVSRRL